MTLRERAEALARRLVHEPIRGKLADIIEPELRAVAEGPRPCTYLHLRPEVEWFARAMEQKLRDNEHKGGWINDKPRKLFARLLEEVKELEEELAKFSMAGKADGVLAEAADVGNFAMMIADVVSWHEHREAQATVKEKA